MELFIVLVYRHSQGCYFVCQKLRCYLQLFPASPPPKSSFIVTCFFSLLCSSLNGSLELVIRPNTSFPFLRVNALCSVFAYQRPFSLLGSSVQFSSVAQSCPTLCDPMNRSTLGLPVHHQLSESTQTHVRRVGDAIQPYYPLSSPSPPAPSSSQHQGLFQ